MAFWLYGSALDGVRPSRSPEALRVAKSVTQFPTRRRLAHRVGEQANRLRFVLWSGFLGFLTLVMVWIALSSAEDQSYSVRAPDRGRETGENSKHAYAYQGLARLLRSQGLGGYSVSGNSPLGSNGLRILLEPQLVSSIPDARIAFRQFISQSKVPVLLVPQVRTTARRSLRLDQRKHQSIPLQKPSLKASRKINSDLGLSQQTKQHAGLSQGQVRGWEVVVEDLIYFTNLSKGAEVWSLDGRDFLYRRWIKDTPVYVLSDPDILNNAGLGQGENTAFVLAMINEIRGPGNVTFDNRDIRVGGSTGLSFVRRLFDWPLGIFTGSVLALAVFLFWFAVGRFGPMLREDRHLAAGKETALEAAVTLLAGTGNNREVLRRYLDGQTRQLASRLGGPKTGDLVRLRAWLDAVAERRGVAEDLRLVPVGNRLNLRETPLSESQAAGAAHTIHAFRKALIHHDT